MTEYHSPNWDGVSPPEVWDPSKTYLPHSVVSHNGQTWLLACDDPACGHNGGEPGPVEKPEHAHPHHPTSDPQPRNPLYPETP